ncbi:MAG: hypothetical protein ACJAZH_000947 [Roseivirga sp.]|jgi:hypothetical protein
MRNLLALLLALLLITSCEKGLLREEASNKPLANYDELWQRLNDRYAYFDLKKINWDSLGTVYRNQLSPNSSDKELFATLDSLLYRLRDGHVNLSAPFNISRNWEWYLNSPQNFNWEIIERNYLQNDYQIAGGIRYRFLADSIGYLYYSSFSSSFSAEQLDYIFTYFKNAKGLIIDVRNNGGGSLNNAFSLAQRLIKTPETVLITDQKIGPGPLDFGNSLQYSLSPSTAPHFTGSTILLSNRRCYSATNTFAALLKSQAHIIQLGDTTGGGGGLPVDYELANGWVYRFSSTRSFLPSGEDIEMGMIPEIPMNLDSNDYNLGRDSFIEAALLELN